MKDIKINYWIFWLVIALLFSILFNVTQSLGIREEREWNKLTVEKIKRQAYNPPTQTIRIPNEFIEYFKKQALEEHKKECKNPDCCLK